MTILDQNSTQYLHFLACGANQAAAQRYLDFNLGLYADPCFLGDYPESVKQAVPALPAFTQEQKQQLLGSVDYFALNHYTTVWVENSPAGLQACRVAGHWLHLHLSFRG